MQPLQLIKLNSSGPAVTKWQQFLLKQGFNTVGNADGIFGTNTDTATKSFQTQQALTADGIVGNNTYAAAMKLGFNAVLVIADFLGIDVYHGDGTVHWSDVKNDTQNIQFAYLKATEGISFLDAEFALNRTNAAAVGIKTGAYHFYHPELSAATQANYFIKAITSIKPNELPPALDFEPSALNGISASQVETDIHVFLQTVESALGMQPIIYTNHNSWVNVLGNPTSCSNYKLWLAAYSQLLPTLFGGWNEWAIWQYTDSGSVNGVSNHSVDINKYNPASGLI